MLTLACADMQKFPLRMKDNDLLVTELYKDPSANRITALSVYLTQKASQFLNFAGVKCVLVGLCKHITLSVVLHVKVKVKLGYIIVRSKA